MTDSLIVPLSETWTKPNSAENALNHPFAQVCVCVKVCARTDLFGVALSVLIILTYNLSSVILYLFITDSMIRGDESGGRK